MNYYDVLQVSRGADTDVIQAAYKRLALKYHPDRNKSAEAEPWMKLLNEAYRVLMDPEQRKTYDESLNPETVSLLALERGNHAFASADYLTAIGEYSKVIEINPKATNAYNNRGIAYAKLGRTSDAICDFSTAIAIDPSDPVAFRNRAKVYETIGRKDLAGDPDFKTASVSHEAHNSQETNKPKRFLRLFFPNGGLPNARLAILLWLLPWALLYVNDGRFGVRLPSLRWQFIVNGLLIPLSLFAASLLVLINISNRCKQSNLSFAVVGRGPPLNAIVWSSIVAVFLGPWIILYFLHSTADYAAGVDFVKNKKYSDAIASFSKVISRDPGHYQSLEYRGLVYFELGLFEPAHSDYCEAIRLQEANLEVLKKKLAEARVKDELEVRGYVSEAKENLVFARKRLAATYDLRGLCYFSRGSFVSAIDDFSMAVKLDPTFVDAQVRLAGAKLLAKSP